MVDSQIASMPPQGIEQAHAKARFRDRHANPATVIALGLFLAAALFGLFGGQPHPTRTIEAPAATLKLQFPEILRNGEFFEMRATITAKRPISDMGLQISSSYWRDLTINTMIPAPAEETSAHGNYRFSYGVMKAGDTINLKIDGQVNPPMFAGTKGELVLMDGEGEIARAPLSLRVYP